MRNVKCVPVRVYLFNPFPTLSAYTQIGSGEVQTEACMALPGRSLWLPVAYMIPTN